MPKLFFRSLSLVALPFLIGTLSANAQSGPTVWTFDEAAPDLRSASCPPDQQADPFETIDLLVKPVSLGPQTEVDQALPDGVSFTGGWELSSADRRFGGLSGLTRQEDGQFLAVSDMGFFIRFGPPGTGPVQSAEIAPLRHATGRAIDGKLTGDAEGLDYRNGLAFVSLERNFRVLAYDLAGCGAAARGIKIGELPKRFGDRRIRANNGPEALALRSDGSIQIGYEQPSEGFVVTGTILTSGPARLIRSALPDGVDPALRLVGLDRLRLTGGHDIQAVLYRAYDRTRGNRNLITLHHAGQTLTSIPLQPPLAVDNFEAILLEAHPDHIRTYILSDDNFSNRQKTLIYAFDIEPPILD